MNVRFSQHLEYYSPTSGGLTVEDANKIRRPSDGKVERVEREKARKERRERRQIAGGQVKEATDKKGSRHADVIDRWDPTGLGTASR